MDEKLVLVPDDRSAGDFCIGEDHKFLDDSEVATRQCGGTKVLGIAAALVEIVCLPRTRILVGTIAIVGVGRSA